MCGGAPYPCGPEDIPCDDSDNIENNDNDNIIDDENSDNDTNSTGCGCSFL